MSLLLQLAFGFDEVDMQIKLSPVLSDAAPLLATIQDKNTIIINGDAFDFSPLQDGETLPMSAIRGRSPFVSDIERDKFGELHLTLRLPHGSNAPQETLFPAAYDTPISIDSGDLPVPPYGEVMA
ncbi:hypothetical protein ACTG2C_22410 [Aeromonas veronii]|uniref:hypothetical protein n=1 Tax=Aeromonas veronii TaxID=654 RepID=UPI002279FC71|nr:hypothetical protein [Aeromonas veronii]